MRRVPVTSITDLSTLIASLRPKLVEGEYVFLTRPTGAYGDDAELSPIAAFIEEEGLTLIVRRDIADDFAEPYSSVFRQVTLGVQSSLSAVGLTALVAARLAEQGIAANVVAAFHHDHVFVPVERATDAFAALHAMASAESN